MWLTVLFMIGITAEAMTGALSAARERMDLFGVMMVAAVTAIGGGSIRDVLLGHYPLTWVKNPHYVVIVVCAAVISVLIPSLMKHFRKLFLGLDALGLAVFSIFGTRIGWDVGIQQGPAQAFILACVASVITGVMGGVLRDLLCDRIPLVFLKELYAAVSFLATCTYVTLSELGVHDGWAVTITLIVTFVFRILAIRFSWHLPVFDYQEQHYERSQSVRPRLFIHRLKQWRPRRPRQFIRKNSKPVRPDSTAPTIDEGD